MEIKIEKIVYPGKSIGYDKDHIIFTDEGLPGEIVEIEPLSRKNYGQEAKTTKIIQPSPKRISPLCSHYIACSPYQYIEYSEQIKIKEFQLTEILSRALNDKIPCIKSIPSPEIYGYRNKIKLSVLWKDAIAYLAYNLPKKEQEFIAIEKCCLVSKYINLLLQSALKIITDKQLEFIKHIEVKQSFDNKELLLILHTDAFDSTGIKSFESLYHDFRLTGIAVIQEKHDSIKETVLSGKNYIKENIRGKDFIIGTRIFFQVNTNILPLLIETLINSLKLTGRENIADLYCGAGFLSISLSNYAKNTLLAEECPYNIAFLKENLKLNKVTNYKILEGKCEKHISNILREKIDVMLLDPPRKGLDKNICGHLLSKPVNKLAYLSCNPTTIARDLKYLKQLYQIKELYFLDFFPNTPHIETLAILEKN